MSKRVYWLWLTTRDDLGAETIRKLTTSFGTPEFLYGATREQLMQTGLKPRQINALCDKDLSRAEDILRVCEQKKIQIITIEDSAYPDRLREIADPPAVLYVRGTLPDFDRAPGVTIVGTRSCSAYGLRMAERFGAALAKAGFTVISGMARGIDTAAHRGCLKADGTTVAVLAGGVDLCYPPENKYLMGDIMLAGAVISENPPGTANEGFRFPIRNRIMSGLAAATLIVEAPLHSGALISARQAFEQGREVFAVPGPLDVPSSAGCNRLIRDECARLVTGPMDIVDALAPMLRQKPNVGAVRTTFLRDDRKDSMWDDTPVRPYQVIQRRKQPEAAPLEPLKIPDLPIVPEPEPPKTARPRIPEGLSGSERAVAEAIAAGADTVDAVSEATGLPASEVAAALVLLELDGIAQHKGGRCSLCGTLNF